MQEALEAQRKAQEEAERLAEEQRIKVSVWGGWLGWTGNQWAGWKLKAGKALAAWKSR
jgi:hypothetical protein